MRARHHHVWPGCDSCLPRHHTRLPHPCTRRYIRLPLVLTFFASEDRVHKLQSDKLKGIVDSVLFEPGRYLAMADTGVLPAMVPTQHPNLLATSYGLLVNEVS